MRTRVDLDNLVDPLKPQPRPSANDLDAALAMLGSADGRLLRMIMSLSNRVAHLEVQGANAPSTEADGFDPCGYRRSRPRIPIGSRPLIPI
jgi:hypothetical protein